MINEYNSKKVHSSGGSTFRIAARSFENSLKDKTFTTSTCPVRDFFNGSYTFVCALLNVRTEIKVMLMNTNYKSYNQVGGLHKHVLGISVGINMIKLQPKLECTELERRDEEYPIKYWLHTENNHYWIDNGCRSNALTYQVINNCYKEQFNNSLSVMGDSHLTYTFFYMLSLIKHPVAKNADKIHHDVYVQNQFRYYWNDYFSSTAANLEKFYKNITQTNYINRKTHSIIFDGGIWDITYNGPHIVVIEFMKLKKTLVKYQDIFKNENLKVKMIWQTMPSFPYFGAGSKKNYWRNVHILGALNYWMCKELEDISIPCNDAWEMTLDWQTLPVCDAHMLCARGGRITGESGKAVVHNLLKMICSIDS